MPLFLALTSLSFEDKDLPKWVFGKRCAETGLSGPQAGWKRWNPSHVFSSEAKSGFQGIPRLAEKVNGT